MAKLVVFHYRVWSGSYNHNHKLKSMASSCFKGKYIDRLITTTLITIITLSSSCTLISPPLYSHLSSPCILMGHYLTCVQGELSIASMECSITSDNTIHTHLETRSFAVVHCTQASMVPGPNIWRQENYYGHELYAQHMYHHYLNTRVHT